MERAFEYVITRDDGLGEMRAAATPELVAAELNLDHVNMAHVRQWTGANVERLMRAAFLHRLVHPFLVPDWDGVVRVTVEDMQRVNDERAKSTCR